MLSDILNMGGITGTLGLLAGVFGLLIALVVPAVISFFMWRVPASLGWLGATLGMGIGLWGAWSGSSSVSRALAMAAPEMKQTLVAMGISVQLYTLLTVDTLAGMALVVAACSAALPAPLRVGPDPEFDLRGLLFALGGALIGVAVAASVALGVYGWQGVMESGLPFLVLLAGASTAGTLAAILPCIRAPSEDHPGQSRVAGQRGFVAVSAAVGVVLLGKAFMVFGEVHAFQAVAVASPDLKAEMLRYGLEIAGRMAAFGWLFALPPLFAGVVGSFPILGRADDRFGLGAGVATLQLLVILGGAYFSKQMLDGTFAQLVGVMGS